MLQKRGIMENLFNYISIEKFKERRYKRKEVIHAEGEKCNEFSVVLSGQVLISTFTETEREYAINILGSGNTFGELLLFSNFDCYLGNIIAVRDTTILSISKQELLNELARNPEFMKEFIELNSSEAMALQTRNKILLQSSIRDRILFYLNERKKIENSNAFYIDSKESLARYLNIPRPSLSRELIAMQNDKLISYGKHYIKLEN